MNKTMTTMSLQLVLVAGLLFPAMAESPGKDQGLGKTREKIRKELVMLPYYSVFDHLAFTFDDGTVTLSGQVSRPTLKSDAERVVERLAGVEQVVNRIEVLPLSRFDEQIRLATFRAIYRQPGLDRLALQANPPIHIIVKNGNVTLEGVVPTQADATRAFIAANGVANVFAVTNNLRVEKSRK